MRQCEGGRGVNMKNSELVHESRKRTQSVSLSRSGLSSSQAVHYVSSHSMAAFLHCPFYRFESLLVLIRLGNSMKAHKSKMQRLEW